MHRLGSPDSIAKNAALPRYDRDAHGAGIVHIGLGAFHRAHQAVHTDDALASAGGDWRIIGVSLRSSQIVDALNEQRGLFTVLERGSAGTSARIVGSIRNAIAVNRGPRSLLAALAGPGIRIVSLTVTEKAYGIDRRSGAVTPDHPAIASDLANRDAPPRSVLGALVEGLKRRRAAGTFPFAVLCCDNLPENGRLIRSGVLDFARRVDPDLAAWIEAEVAFPGTMVDRITPAPTQETFDDAARLTGLSDLAAVETEPFSQWVIEDNFPAGRPAWEAGGAIFTGDVAPYERMKLRMLNGAHSLIAYAGFVSGLEYVRDAMAHGPLKALVVRHLRAAAATLAPLDGINFIDYANSLVSRFENPAMAHRTWQIAMDGTEKLPQRLLEPAVYALAQSQDIRAFAFAVAAWMDYCNGQTDSLTKYELRDPREAELRNAIEKSGGDPASLVSGLHELPGLFPTALRQNYIWRTTVADILSVMLENGMRRAIELEGASIRPA